MSHDHSQTVPRGALIAIAALLGFTLIAVAAARLMPQASLAGSAQATTSLDVLFADAADGSVLIRSPRGEVIATLAPGTNGFVRGVMRSFARERRALSLGADQPFRITGRVDGTLTLTDLATGRLIDLGSFGVTNASTFAQLLDLDQRVAAGAGT